jgi:hypothetical protein
MADRACRELNGPLLASLVLLAACTQASPSPQPLAADAAAPSAPPGPPPHATRISLIDPTRWTQLSQGEDPFADRLPEVACAPDAAVPEVLSETLAYGVDTGRCNYLTARQTTLTHVAAGESVVIRLWHFELDAPNPGEAHAVALLDGLPLLDRRIPIPSPGGLVKVEVPIDRAIAAGAPVHFHLHNHGANSWALVEVSTGPAEPP